MKKVIRLTESDLMRIVKRVINEDMKQVGDKTWISQGYGKDQYQYKVVITPQKDQWGIAGGNPKTEYFVSRKGSNPKWIKITDEKMKKTIMQQQFPDIDGEIAHTDSGLYRSDIGGLTKVVTRGDEIKAFAEYFPCVERAMKPTDKKYFAGESVIFIIDGISYGIHKDSNSPSGWSISGMDPKNPLDSKLRNYKTCDEFNRRKK